MRVKRPLSFSIRRTSRRPSISKKRIVSSGSETRIIVWRYFTWGLHLRSARLLTPRACGRQRRRASLGSSSREGRMKILMAGAVALGFCALAAASAQDWSENKDEITSGMTQSKAICRGVLRRDPPAADKPDAKIAASLKGCDSEKLYYGIGMKADPVRARQCAFLEMQREPDEGVFAGRTMLMTIYANGVGAKRDLDVATHLACGLEGAPAEVDGRVTHLAELKAKNWAGHDFDFCDDITSGLAMGYCADHAASVAAPVRET